jgi:hypothetical protein
LALGVAARQRIEGAVRHGLAIAVVAALPALLDLALRFPAYHARVSYLYYVSGPLKVAGLYATALLASALLYAALLAIPRLGRALTAGLVGILFTGQMAYRSVMGDFGGEREIASLAASEPAMAFGAATSFFSLEMVLWAAAGSLAAAAVALAARRARPSPGLLRASALIALALFVHLGLWNYLYRKCHAFPTEPVMHTVRALIYFEKEQREFLSIPREELAPDVASRRPDDNVVLILDESVRYGFLSIHDIDLLDEQRGHDPDGHHAGARRGAPCAPQSHAVSAREATGLSHGPARCLGHRVSEQLPPGCGPAFRRRAPGRGRDPGAERASGPERRRVGEAPLHDESRKLRVRSEARCALPLRAFVPLRRSGPASFHADAWAR